MTEYYTSTTLPDGNEIDRRLAYVKYLEQQNSQPVGIEWDTASSSPTLKRIDINGNELTVSSSFFDNHTIWGRMRRCVRHRTTGVITYGSDNKGTGLTLDGSTGDVLVEIPTARYKYEVSGTKKRWWLIPYTTEDTLYPIHPSAVQRSATSTARSKFYVGAYEAGLRNDAGSIKLKSITGAQPITGGEIKTLAFTSGSTVFTINETLTGAVGGATAQVVEWYISSGTWAGGDAAGTVYIKQYSAAAYQAENINGSIAGSDCATVSGAVTAISLTMDQAEGYANAKGTGFGICNIWTYAYLQLLFYIEYGTFNSQTALAQGVVNLASGVGYAGKITGVDSIDSRLGVNGTGIGSGINGSTPVCWRGIENLWGNIWEFIVGINLYLSDGSWRILKRDGTGTPAGTLASGSYETGAGAIPIVADGYISGLQSNEMGALVFIPSADTGSSSTYLCDYFYLPTTNPGIVFSGGAWFHGLVAGVGTRAASRVPSYSDQTIGVRLEFLP